MPSRLLSFVVPATCWVCGGPAPDAAPLCAGCRRALPWLPAGCCPRCALPAHGRGGCPAERLAFDAAVSVVAYEGAASSVVRAVKDRGGLALVPMMGAQLVAALPADLLRGARVVPVPPHPLRGRLRGFDAAGLLAAELATRTGRPLDADLLRRRGGWWRRQRGATRAERLATGRLVVEVRRPIPPPAVAALVDDVHTTGATLHACALALRAAGCERVVAVTWARAL
ncbi:MAG: ComF family protein [Solirubrobacteraceae bacterium]|nr:ComF family protein [Solirubrobacteraceae bacterium]